MFKNMYLFKIINPLHVNINILMKNNYIPKQQKNATREAVLHFCKSP